ncbi:hypothetical protein LFT48_19100 [Arthrobacter sp. FW305-123]|nr:hypothetical protein LFT48_19100 [Arthrobacter sp. FW305-123]
MGNDVGQYCLVIADGAMRGNRADIFDAVLHHRISSDQDGKPGSGQGDFPAAAGTWGSPAYAADAGLVQPSVTHVTSVQLIVFDSAIDFFDDNRSEI